MATVAVLQTDLLLNSAAFRTGMAQAAQTANATLGQIQAEAKKTAASIDLMSRAAEAFIGFEALKESASALVEAQVQMQQIHYTLISATGSATGAAAAFDFLKQKSQELGLNLQPAAQAFGQLAAAASASQIPMDQTQKLFTAFGQASTTLHLSSEQSQHALLALTEMMSRGTIQARQLNQQLGFAIPGSAARFKNAVMEAIKGTDLAGQSFMELEKKGELVTSRFMPQLIQAITESGHGWKEAAQGLNAQMNRVSTAWFKLKNDVSGGLFTDTATLGAKFMADNLDHIASTLEVVAGLASARLISSGLQSGAGFVSGIRASIAATIAETEATAVNTAAKVANARERVVSLAARSAELAEMKAFMASELAEATTQQEVTTATKNYTQAAIAAARANGAYRASVVGLTEAQMANAAAQAESAAASEAGTAAGMLGKIGSGALALIGGPIGLAVAAVGALAYGIYAVKKADDDWKQATVEQVKSLQDMRAQVQSATDDFQKLHSEMTLAGTLTLFNDLKNALDQQKTELADLEKQAKATQEALTFSQGQGLGGAMMAANYSTNLRQLKDRIQSLKDQIQPTQDQLNALSDQLGGSFVSHVDLASNAIARFRSGMSIGGIFSGLAADLNQGTKQFGEYVKAIDEARKKSNAIGDQLASEGTQWAEQAATKGMNHLQLAKHQLEQQIASIRAQTNLPDATQNSQIAQAQEEAKSTLAAAAVWDAANKQHKAGVDKLGNAYNALMKSIQEKVSAQQQEVSTGTRVTEADKLMLAVRQDLLTNLKNLSPVRKQQLLDEAQSLVNLTNENDARKAKNDALQREAVLQDKLDRQRALQTQTNARSLEGIGHGAQWNTEQKAFEKLLDQYNRDKDAQGKLFDQGKIGAAEYAQNIGAIQSAYSTAVVSQKQFFTDQATAQANWKTGAQAAFENFRASAANVAGATQSLFTSAFDGIASSLANFVTTGKINFQSMADSFINGLLQIELKVAESQILTSMFGGSGGSIGGSGGSTSQGSGLASIFSGLFGGGRASGGPVSSGSMYQVNENGPELLTTGGNTYLMMGGQGGHVTPNGGPGGGGSSSPPAAPIVNVSITGAPSQPSISTSRGSDGSINIEAKFEEMLASSMVNRKRGAQAMEHVYGLGRGGQSFG